MPRRVDIQDVLHVQGKQQHTYCLRSVFLWELIAVLRHPAGPVCVWVCGGGVGGCVGVDGVWVCGWCVLLCVCGCVCVCACLCVHVCGCMFVGERVSVCVSMSMSMCN